MLQEAWDTAQQINFDIEDILNNFPLIIDLPDVHTFDQLFIIVRDTIQLLNAYLNAIQLKASLSIVKLENLKKSINFERMGVKIMQWQNNASIKNASPRSVGWFEYLRKRKP